MDDAGRNLDVQTRGVEERIRSVEVEIRKLEQKIERVEEQIETCSNLQEKTQLRGKEAQLRGEESQLREQILQGRDKCTEFNWLCQELLSWNLGSCSRTPSTTQKELIYTPVRVEYYVVVYVNKADKLKRIYQKVDNPILTRGEKNLTDIASVVVASTCDFVSKKQLGSSIKYSREANLEVPPDPLAKEGNSTNLDVSKIEDKEVQKCLFYAKPPVWIY